MKKAFTLVELMVAIAVIAILMAFILRIGNIGSDSEARNVTISRLQRLENALSGYYAAFGTYPSVKLHGSRNIYLKVSDHGIQNTDGEENTSLWGWLKDGEVKDAMAESQAWNQVKAACIAQPIACYYPYPEDKAYQDYVEAYSEQMKSYVEQIEEIDQGTKAKFAAGFDTGVPLGRFGAFRNKIDWTEIQLFKFGLLSYLLPRYLFMMDGPEELFSSYAQWTGNNELPCDPLRGTPYSGGWKGIRDDANPKYNNTARVANIPSQAVCARWMANFEKTISCSQKKVVFFGINVVSDVNTDNIEMNEPNLALSIYSPGGYREDSKSGQYVLNSMTIKDGWGVEFFYYSPAPYQSYTLWSAGANKRTFPPWISRSSLGSDANACVGYWIKDDIGGLRK